MVALESGSEQRCTQVSAAASAEIAAVNAEKEIIQSSLYAAQADISTSKQLKLQVRYLSYQKNSYEERFFLLYSDILREADFLTVALINVIL